MKLSFFLILILHANFMIAQKANIVELCKLDKAVHESSGLAVAGGKIWTHNDSQGQPVLYGFDESCKVTDILYVNGKNTDWEDLAQDEDGNIFIGDFGNDKQKRRDLKIYIIPNPALLKENVVNPGLIEFSYSDQTLFPPDTNAHNYDMEAMIWFDNHLYLFSKNRTKPFTGYSRVYRLSDKPGKHTAQLIDSVYLGASPMLTSWVTSADISPDKKKLVLLGHDKIWLFICFEGDQFFSGKKHTIALSGAVTQKEAICFIDNNKLYITDELVMRVMGGKLYSLDLSGLKLEECK